MFVVFLFFFVYGLTRGFSKNKDDFFRRSRSLLIFSRDVSNDRMRMIMMWTMAFCKVVVNKLRNSGYGDCVCVRVCSSTLPLTNSNFFFCYSSLLYFWDFNSSLRQEWVLPFAGYKKWSTCDFFRFLTLPISRESLLTRMHSLFRANASAVCREGRQ